jgi:hypothetical protein
VKIVCQMGDALVVVRDKANYSPDVFEDVMIRTVDATLLMYRTMAELDSTEADASVDE